jgi:cell division septation protein DedD
VPKNDDGEFELILGNRQLLSVFFIVVVLLGVFFTMGYIVGRSSTPGTGTEIASAKKAPAKPLVIEAPDREPTPAAQPAPPVKQAQPAPPPPEAKKKTEPPKPEPPPAAKSEPPASGQSYLQLAATSQREGDIMVDVLRKKGFKARAAEIPEKPGTFRILVGPVDAADMNKMRGDLQAAGFPGNAAIKRTF